MTIVLKALALAKFKAGTPTGKRAPLDWLSVDLVDLVGGSSLVLLHLLGTRRSESLSLAEHFRQGVADEIFQFTKN